jgi:hypothetical protein
MTTNRFGWRARSSRKKEPRPRLSVKRIGIRKTPQRKIAETKATEEHTNENLSSFQHCLPARGIAHGSESLYSSQ